MYKRKSSNKSRTYKRSYSKKKSWSRTFVPKPLLLGDSMRLIMSQDIANNINSATTPDYVSGYIIGNGMYHGYFDSVLGIGTANPGMYNQMFGLYNKCVVLGSWGKFTFINLNQSPTIVAIAPLSTSSPPATNQINLLAESPYAQSFLLNGSGTTNNASDLVQKTFNISMKSTRMYGNRRKESDLQLDDTVCMQDSTSNPTNPWFWVFMALNSSTVVTTCNIDVHIQLKYDVVFYDRKNYVI